MPCSSVSFSWKCRTLKSKYFSRYSCNTVVTVSREILGTRLPFAVVIQPVVTMLLVALPPAPHGSIANPDNLGGFPPLQASRHRSQYHLLHFHHPLHFRGA